MIRTGQTKGLQVLFVHFLLLSLLVASSVAQAASQTPAAKLSPPPATTPLTIFTYSAGTQSYIVSAAISEMVRKYTPIKASVEPTAGPPAWKALLAKGEGEMGLMTSIEANDSYYGVRTETGGPQPMRLLLNSYSSQHLIYSRSDRGIKSIPDLRGKRVSIYNPPSLSMTIIAPLALEAFGLFPDKDYTALAHSSPAEKKEALIEGRIDAYYYTFPGTHALEVKQAVGLASIPIPEKSVNYIKEKTGYPVFSGGIKPSVAKEYGIPPGATTFSNSTNFVVRENLPANVAYYILKAVYEHFDEFAAIHTRCAETTLENAVSNPSMPFHEGAIMFYKEKGVWTPELERLQKEMLAKPRAKK